MIVTRINRGSWGKVKAFVDVKTAEGFEIKGFKVVEGSNGLFVGMPSESYEEDGETKWRNLVYINDTARSNFEASVLNRYHDITDEGSIEELKRNEPIDKPKEIKQEVDKFDKYIPR